MVSTQWSLTLFIICLGQVWYLPGTYFYLASQDTRILEVEKRGFPRSGTMKHGRIGSKLILLLTQQIHFQI